MRKHFLILMLLTLLPLSTWADEKQSIKEGFVFTLGTTTAQYNGQVPTFTPKLVNNNLTTPVILTYGTDYELEFYKNNEKLEEAPSAVGSYTVKAHGIGDYTDYTANAIAVTITKAHITVTIGEQLTEDPYTWTFKKAYHAADPAMPAVSTWKFAVDNGETLTSAQIKDKLTIPTTPTYTYDGENANADKTGAFLGSITTGYTISFPGIKVNDANDENYDVEFTPRSMKICQVELAAAGEGSAFTYENERPDDFSGYTYSGKQPEDKTIVKYKYGTGTKDVYTLTANDFVVKYYKDGTEIIPKDAGTYTAKVFAGQSGNFVDPTESSIPVIDDLDDLNEPGNDESGNDEDPTESGIVVDAFGYTINKAKSLTILVNPNSRAYNAKAFSADEAKFTISGWVEADKGTTISGLAAKNADDESFAKDKGDYKVELVITPVLAEGDVVTGYKFEGSNVIATRKDETTFNPSDNYEIIPFGNTWTITAAPLTFTVGGKTIQSGETATTEDVTFTVAGVQKVNGNADGEDEAVADAFKVALIPGDYTNVSAVGYDAFTVVRKEASDYTTVVEGEGEGEGEGEVVGEGEEDPYAAATDLLANYSWDENSITKGKLKVTGIGFDIMPVASDLTYGEAYVPKYFAHNGTLQVTLNETETNKVKYIVKKDGEIYSADKYKQLPVGEYTVEIDTENMAALLPSANYSVDAVNAQPVSFNVTQKELTLAIADVTTLHVGDTQENLQKIYPISTETETGILESDVDKVKFIFSFDEEKVTLNADTKKIESVSTEDGAIKIAFNTETGDDTYKNYKFPVNAPTGKLTLATEYVLDLASSTDMAGDIKDAANNGHVYKVKLPSRQLKANQWYTVVLPFPLTTVALVNHLQKKKNETEFEPVFAIVNRLSTASTAKNVSFKLEMKGIPANEPFLIKVAEDIDLKDTKEIQTAISYTESAEVGGDDFAGNIFKGVYTDTEIKLVSGEHMVGFLGVKGETFKTTTLENKWYSSETAKTIKPLEAYLYYATVYTPGQQAPMVTVEDYENGATVIKNLNMETMKAYAVDGWYTLNGVKLQGMPTEKGIYINNGKKVVIK